MPMTPMICENCGITFQVSTTEMHERRSCSRACLRALRVADEVPRFWRSVEKTDGCWLWRGSCQGGGYGLFSTHARRKITAHRYSFALAHGPIPSDAFICHHCDVPLCVRPEHLYAGTAKDNVRDMIIRGRARFYETRKGEAHGMAILTEDAVREIRRRYGPPRRISGYRARFVEPRAVSLGEEFGVSKATIMAIVHRRVWQNVID